MLNKKLVLGSLAGATLLAGAMFMMPTEAHAIAGQCANCHTMHAAAASEHLLGASGCVACHTTGGVNSTTTGVDGSGVPQVDQTGANMLAGGYFNGGTAANEHSVLLLAQAFNLATAPGDATTPFDSTLFDCESCHSSAAHHAGSSATNYRFLGVNSGTVAKTNYGVNAGYAATDYNAVAMNSVCVACHSDFHGTTNTQSAGTWIRHPTEVDTFAYGGTHAGSAVIPTGEGGTNDSDVMCISCHYAHGGVRADMLRYDNTANIAGTDATTSIGCELCHGEK